MITPKFRAGRMERIAAPAPLFRPAIVFPDAAAVRPTCILEFVR